jgi:hypothetical protein
MDGKMVSYSSTIISEKNEYYYAEHQEFMFGTFTTITNCEVFAGAVLRALVVRRFFCAPRTIPSFSEVKGGYMDVLKEKGYSTPSPWILEKYMYKLLTYNYI